MRFCIDASSVAATVLAVVLSTSGGACSRSTPREPPRTGGTLVVSADTRGWIVPCGCAANQSGGLLRRGTYVAQLRQKGDVLLLDAGGLAAASSEYDRIKFEAILKGLVAMGLAAQNLAGPELALGAEVLHDAALRTGAPLVSANVRKADGERIAAPMRRAKLGSLRIAVTGVAAPGPAPADLRIDDPREAVLSVLQESQPDHDALVVLAFLPEEELARFAESLPEADVVVGGNTGQAVTPRRAGPTLVASAANKGKFLIEIALAGTGGAVSSSGKVVEIDAGFNDHPAQQQNLEAYLSELGRRDLTAQQSGLARAFHVDPPAGYAVAGNDACRTCHEEDDVVWSHSRHAHAFDALQTKGAHVDPYCQQCHTNGFGLPGGFVSAATTRERVDVGCESCHGPSLAHAKDPAVRTAFSAADECSRCHDQENSPAFDYPRYWALVAHGALRAPPEASAAQEPAP